MHQDTNTADIDLHISSIQQDTYVAIAQHHSPLASAFALSIGLHIALIAILVQAPQRLSKSVRQASPIMVVMVKLAPKKSVQFHQSSFTLITKAEPKFSTQIAKQPEPSRIVVPKRASGNKHPIQPLVTLQSKYKPKPESNIEPKKSKHKQKPKSELVPKYTSKAIPKPAIKLTSKIAPESSSATAKRPVLQNPKSSLPIKRTTLEHAAVPNRVVKPIKAKHSVLPYKFTKLDYATQHLNFKTTPTPPVHRRAESLVKNSESVQTQISQHPQTDTKLAADVKKKAKSVPISRPDSVPMAYSPPNAHPAYLNNPSPTYPRSAQRAHMEGRCLLDVIVNANGIPSSVRILQSSGYSILDQAAVTAVSHWRFVPARRDGQVVTASVVVPIRFHLAGGT